MLDSFLAMPGKDAGELVYSWPEVEWYRDDGSVFGGDCLFLLLALPQETCMKLLRVDKVRALTSKVYSQHFTERKKKLLIPFLDNLSIFNRLLFQIDFENYVFCYDATIQREKVDVRESAASGSGST